MASIATITLERLRCVRENDTKGHSEPYLWPMVLRFDSTTIGTSMQVVPQGILPPHIRSIIKNGMRAGDVVPITGPGGVFRTRFADGVENRGVILIVGLMEWDSTPLRALEPGYFSFVSETAIEVGRRLLQFPGATEAQENALVAEITGIVKPRVESAIRSRLNFWEKIFLNQDDFVGNDHKAFFNMTLQAGPFTLEFNSGHGHYFIDGNFRIEDVPPPPPPDPCQAELDRIAAAQEEIEALVNAIQQLQAELQGASPSQKAAILAEIRRIVDEDMPAAIAGLEAARAAYEACSNPIGNSGSGSGTGLIDMGVIKP
jgi:hypothetical protein